jgi:GGDEF domain-containing protein
VTPSPTSPRRQDEEQLRLALTVFRNSVEAIIVTDAEERILSVNRPSPRSPATARGRHRQDPRMLGPGTTTALLRRHVARHRNLGFWQGEIHDRRKDGTLYPAALSISTVRDTLERTTHYVAVFPTSPSARPPARIAYLAQHDPLTGLPNRTLLQDRLDQALAHAVRHGSRIAVLFLDLDRFKTINDSLGHMTGDRLLQGVALRLSDCTRNRHHQPPGGDEFLIVLTGVDGPDDAARVAEKILDRLGPPFDIDGQLLAPPSPSASPSSR